MSDLMSVLRLFMRPPKKDVFWGFGGAEAAAAEASGDVPLAGTACGGGDGVDECSHCSRTLSFWSIFSRAFSSADSTGKGLLLALVQGSLRLDCGTTVVGSTTGLGGT